MSFYNNFVCLCVRDGISPSAAAIEMGFKKSNVTYWKNGRTPSDASLVKIANYFQVTVDELVSDEQKEKAPDPKIEGYSELQQAAIQFVLSLPPDKLERFVKMGRAAFEEGK